MDTKIYKASTKITVPIVIGGKIRNYVEFADENNTFVTDQADTQKALETLPLFGKHYQLLRTIPGIAQTNPKPTTPNEQPPASSPDNIPPQWVTMNDITDWQTAKEILRADPYNTPYQSLATPEAIQKKAAELYIKFPNLTL